MADGRGFEVRPAYARRRAGLFDDAFANDGMSKRVDVDAHFDAKSDAWRDRDGDRVVAGVAASPCYAENYDVLGSRMPANSC